MLLKKILPHVAAVITFLLLSIIYFYPQLNGEVVNQSDNVQYMGMSRETFEVLEERGDMPLWTNSMFGGMPTYQINTNRQGNLLTYLNKFLQVGFDRPIGYFFVAQLSFYILLVVLGVNPWLSIIGGIGFGFNTNSLTLFEAGHNTKLLAISYFPLLVAGILLAFRKKYIWGAVLFAIGTGLNVLANHPQMSYYLLLTLLIYGIARLIYDSRNGEIVHFAKATGFLIVAGVFGLASSAVNLMTTYEYSQETMRGEPILEQQQQPAGQIASSSETEGLSWDYAMQWSNGFRDLFSSYIPGAVGGSSNEPITASSELYQLVGNQIGDRAPLYWGELPFTSGPAYFGAVFVLLFIMGLWLVEGPVKWWLGLGTLLTFLISMGKNFDLLNAFLFDYFPLFNKFRTPNSILAIASLLVPLLGMLALSAIEKREVSKEKALRSLYIGGGIAGGLALFFWLLGPGFFDFLKVDENYQPQILDAFVNDRQDLMRSDALRALALILLSGGLIWAYINKKLQTSFWILGLGVLVLFDMWTIGKRYVNTTDFIPERRYEANFEPRQVDQQILAQEESRGDYRVLDLTIPTFQAASTSYFHNTLGGYHAAKLQRMQDIIDYYLAGEINPQVLSMLNTKYIITGEQGQAPQVQQNPNALGNAWLISDFQTVPTANAEIDALANFQADQIAVVHEDFSDYISGLSPTGGGEIDMIAYEPDHLKYQFNSTTEQFAVFSEVWYGPNKGWQAYIDDEPLEHIRVNYLLRGLRIPAGQHTIEFKFEPQTFYTGRTISLVSSLIILVGFLGFTGYRGYDWYQKLPAEEPKERQAPQSKKARPKRKPRKGKRK